MALVAHDHQYRGGRAGGIECVHVWALGNPKPKRKLYWSGDIAGGATAYRKRLNNGPRSALVSLRTVSATSARACSALSATAACHRAVIVEALHKLHPKLAVSHL